MAREFRENVTRPRPPLWRFASKRLIPRRRGGWVMVLPGWGKLSEPSGSTEVGVSRMPIESLSKLNLTAIKCVLLDPMASCSQMWDWFLDS